MACVFFQRIKLWCVAAGVLSLAGCGRPPSLPQKAPELPKGTLPTIIVIGGGPDKYWNQAQRGAQDAGKKLGARIMWQVPTGPDLVKSQQSLVLAAIKNAQGIILAPLDSTKLMQPVGTATRSGIAVAIIGRDVFTIQNKLSYIHNDDYQTGVLAARHLAKITTPASRIALLEATPRPEVQERMRGFGETLQDRTLVPTQVADARAALPADINAAFCADETLSNTLLGVPSLPKQLAVFGASDALEEAFQAKRIGMLLTPDYYQMAYQSVKAILDYRVFNFPPREIKIAPRVLESAPAKASP